MGRRQEKLDRAGRAAFVRYLIAGDVMATAAAKIGCSRQAVYKAMRRSRAFELRVIEARKSADDMVEASLYRRALAGEVIACIFWLKNRRPAEWRDRHDLTLGGEEGSTLIYRAALADGRPLSPESPALSGGPTP